MLREPYSLSPSGKVGQRFSFSPLQRTHQIFDQIVIIMSSEEKTGLDKHLGEAPDIMASVPLMGMI